MKIAQTLRIHETNIIRHLKDFVESEKLRPASVPHVDTLILSKRNNSSTISVMSPIYTRTK